MYHSHFREECRWWTIDSISKSRVQPEDQEPPKWNLVDSFDVPEEKEASSDEEDGEEVMET